MGSVENKKSVLEKTSGKLMRRYPEQNTAVGRVYGSYSKRSYMLFRNGDVYQQGFFKAVLQGNIRAALFERVPTSELDRVFRAKF